MPTKRIRRAQEALRTIDHDVMDWFAEVITEPPLEYEYLMPEAEKQATWRTAEQQVLEYYVSEHPGRRPQVWWEWSAPRQPVGAFPGWFFDGKLAEPRRHVAGSGRPPWEAGFQLVPEYRHGISRCWAGFRASDPPVFESEPAYLRRWGLLLPGEEERLTARDFEDTVEIDFAEIPLQCLGQKPAKKLS